VAEVRPVPPAPERYRYRGPRFEFEFDAWNEIALVTFRWVGERAGLFSVSEDLLFAGLTGQQAPTPGEQAGSFFQGCAIAVGTSLLGPPTGGSPPAVPVPVLVPVR
jgi:hypothetical protein